MAKKIITLAELVNVFSCVGVERFLDILIGYSANLEEYGSEVYPFAKTDKSWVDSLMDCYLQAVETCDGDINLCKAFRYEINDYLADCRKENSEMYYLVEGYKDEDAF